MEKRWKIGVAGVLVGMMLGYAGHGVLNPKMPSQSTQVLLETDDVLRSPRHEPPLSRTDQRYIPLVHGTLVF